jgi:hypothetical protein
MHHSQWQVGCFYENLDPTAGSWSLGALKFVISQDAPQRPLELVVVPRSEELEAAELDLRPALVALVAGTRASVSPAMVRDYLANYLGITG